MRPTLSLLVLFGVIGAIIWFAVAVRRRRRVAAVTAIGTFSFFGGTIIAAVGALHLIAVVDRAVRGTLGTPAFATPPILQHGDPFVYDFRFAKDAGEGFVVDVQRGFYVHEARKDLLVICRLALLALEPGDRVADIFAGGGYYSELIATVVGDDGEVLLLNNAAYKAFASKGLAARTEGRDIGSVTIYDREAENLDLGENSLDAALIIMSYHDLYHVDEKNGWRAIDAEDFLGQIHRGV